MRKFPETDSRNFVNKISEMFLALEAASQLLSVDVIPWPLIATTLWTKKGPDKDDYKGN